MKPFQRNNNLILTSDAYEFPEWAESYDFRETFVESKKCLVIFNEIAPINNFACWKYKLRFHLTCFSDLFYEIEFAPFKMFALTMAFKQITMCICLIIFICFEYYQPFECAVYRTIFSIWPIVFQIEVYCTVH